MRGNLATSAVRPALVAVAILGAATTARAQAPSVLVETMAPVRGDLPEILVSYGVAKPALDSSMTVSLQSSGRVLRFYVTPGEAVESGQPLLDFEVSQSALGSYRQAETALQTARIERTRIAQLVKQQLATKDQLTMADKLITDAQTTIDTLQKSGADKPQLQIKAPFAGVVSSIPVAQGDTIAQGAPMMAVMRADNLVVSVGVEPSMRARVRRGEPVELLALTDGGRPARGEVLRIDGLLNPRTHLVDTDVSTTAALLPGASFEARIEIGRLRGYVAPRDVVLSDARGDHVFQVAAGKARRVGVVVKGTHGDYTVFEGPLAPGEPLVVQGNPQLDDGMAVRLAAPDPVAEASPSDRAIAGP